MTSLQEKKVDPEKAPTAIGGSAEATLDDLDTDLDRDRDTEVDRAGSGTAYSSRAQSRSRPASRSQSHSRTRAGKQESYEGGVGAAGGASSVNVGQKGSLGVDWWGGGAEARQARYRTDVFHSPAAQVGGKDRKGEEEGEGEIQGHEGMTKTMGWWKAFFNMVAYAIALGVLSIPLVVATIGVVPFVLITFLFAYFTWYTGIQYWRLRTNYPGIHNLADAGDLLFGVFGREFFGWSQLLFSVFLQGNHVLLGATAFRTLGWESCAVALAAVFAIISFVLTLPRSYALFSIEAIISFTSIVTVVIIAMIASAVTGPINAPADAPPLQIVAFGPTGGGTNFLTGMLEVLNLFISFGSTPAYLPIMSEMRNADDFPKSLGLLVGAEVVIYLIVGGVIYRNLGQYTTSPSLNSLSPTMAKVAYGIGLPTIIIAGCESGQVAAKQIFVKVFRKRPQHLNNSTMLGWVVWTVIVAITWVFAFILSQVIPFFSAFLGVEGALFWATFLAYGAIFWLWLNKGQWFTTTRNQFEFGSALVIMACAAVLCVAGIWSAAISIRDQFNSGQVGSVFSCDIST